MTLILCQGSDIRGTLLAWQTGKDFSDVDAIVQDVKGIIHRERGVLLDVLPTIRARLRTALRVRRAPRAKDIGPDRTGVVRKEPLTVDETHEIALVQEAPPRRARAEPEVLSLRHRVRAIRVPVRVGAEQRELVERRGEDVGDRKLRGDANGGRGLGEAVVEEEPVDLAVHPHLMLGAGDRCLETTRVPLRERLRPVCFEVLDEPANC